MATHDYVIDNATASQVRSDLNGALAAVKSNNASSSAPTNPTDGMLYYDTTTSSAHVLKIYKSSFRELFTIGASNVSVTIGTYKAPTSSGFDFQNSSGTSRMTLNNDGDLAADGDITAGGNMTAYSDVRLKENVATLDGSKVYEMRGVSYTKDGSLGAGVIAQELSEVAPELVDDSREYLSVAYGNITGYLIEAVKDLKNAVDEQAALIKELREKVDE
jgi:hypothetical protein